MNTSAAPYNGSPGDPPALNEREITAILAFLETLSDRAYPPAP